MIYRWIALGLYVFVGIVSGGTTFVWTWEAYVWLLSIQPFIMSLLLIVLPMVVFVTAVVADREVGAKPPSYPVDYHRKNPEPAKKPKKSVVKKAAQPVKQPPKRKMPTPVDLDSLNPQPNRPHLVVVKPVQSTTEPAKPRIWGVDP